jgi:small-conductance mechanosensitive channel
MKNRRLYTVLLLWLLTVSAGVAFGQTGIEPEQISPEAAEKRPAATEGADRNKLQKHLADYQAQFDSAWNYEIIVIDNNSVTVKKVLFSLLILGIGLIAAKFLIRFAVARLARYARLKNTASAAIQKVFSFTAYCLVFLFALRMVNIPLAAFAFLGGAVAIGLGFGAQNLINNFISGFIIMGERPINIGDLIEVEGILGQVEDIGARCTRVRTGENIHILVPNSSFLEKNITNWTLSDRKIRTQVTVGVVYGSPVREVERLLISAASENQLVLKDPEPFVLFRDFGDSALIFETYFWISIRRLIERRLIESSIRFRIDELFREAGITIAFPQLDVHLDTQRQLELRLTNHDDTPKLNEK